MWMLFGIINGSCVNGTFIFVVRKTEHSVFSLTFHPGWKAVDIMGDLEVTGDRMWLRICMLSESLCMTVLIYRYLDMAVATLHPKEQANDDDDMAILVLCLRF